VVNYATASRDGRPFNELIENSQILPNQAIRRCTQWLKIKTSWRYVRNVLKWPAYQNAIGLRYDEPTRSVKPDPKSTPGEDPVCPLKKARVGRRDVMDFWQEMRGGVPLDEWLAMKPADRPGWDLALRPDQGNCDLCFLKGQGKLTRLMRERPQDAQWWIEKEQKFVGKTRLFEAGRFRKRGASYAQTLELSKRPGLFDRYEDDGPSVSCRCTD
jgi:hypothetical protein